jgi:hypothetical protein
MEVVLAGNLLEAMKDLGEGEILFCPMLYWAKSLSDKVGGIVEDDGRVGPPSAGEFDRARDQILLYSPRSSTYREPFFYATRSDWMWEKWEELSKGVKENEEYLKKEVVGDLEHVDPLFKYNSFLDISNVTEESKKLKSLFENLKTLVEREVKEGLIKAETEKIEKYQEILGKILENNKFPSGLELEFILPAKVREKGTENYIKEEKIYKEATKGGEEVLMILPDDSLRYGVEAYQVPNGIGVKYYFRNPNIDKEKVYVILGEFKIFYDGRERTYLFGFPFFRVRFSSVDVEFRSRSVVIGKRKEPKNMSGVVPAKLHIKNFLITLEYTKDPEVMGERDGKRTIETSKSIQVSIKAEERTDSASPMTPERYKICNVEIKEDGGFSVRMDYSNIYKVQIKTSGKAEQEANKIAEKEPREGVSWLIENWTRGRKSIISGKIIGEKVKDYTGKEKIFVLKEEKYSGEGKNEIDRHIKSKLEEVLKRVMKVESKQESRYLYLYEILTLRPEENEEIIKEIQTSFIQDKLERNIKYLEKIEELCFESRDGEKHTIKHPELEEQEENLLKMAREVVLYGTGINVEKLRGKDKSITEVLKLLSYSYPFLTQYTINRILSELKEKVSLALSKDVIPLEEIEMSIETINPSISASDIDPKVLALFSIEGDRVKVYINEGEKESIYEFVTEYVKIGIGNIEIRVGLAW